MSKWERVWTANGHTFMASTSRCGFLYKLTVKNSRRAQRESCFSACVRLHRAPSVRARGAGPRGLSAHCPCQRYDAWNAAGGPSGLSALVGPLLSRRVWDLSVRLQGRGGTMEVMQPSSGTQTRQISSNPRQECPSRPRWCPLWGAAGCLTACSKGRWWAQRCTY